MKKLLWVAILCLVSSGAVLAQSTGNPFVFNNTDDQFLSCQGIASRVATPCQSISDFNDRQMCSGLATSSQDPCRLMTDRNLQLTCFGMAFAPNFPSNCRDITDVNIQRFCNGASSFNASFCNDIPDTNTRLLCIAMSNRDSSFCATISDLNDRKFCLGVTLHDLTYCVKEQPPTRGDGKATIVYDGERSGDFHDPANLSAVLLDTTKTPAAPIADAILSFHLGQETCQAPTDAQGRASCSLTPGLAAGDQPLGMEFSGDFVYAAVQSSDTFTVRREQSQLAITSPPAGPGVPAAVRAVLREDGAVPVAGRQVSFQAGAVSATAVTGADGSAAASLTLPAGDYLVTASFAGDGFYESASATQTLHVLPPQIAILPQSNAAPAGTTQAVTAQILDGGVSLAGERFGFEVVSGPNAGAAGACDSGGCASDSSGRATFRYTGGPAGGRDTVRVWLDLNHNGAFDAGEAQATA
ncbi:MAG TPA: Ig-like domain-containing protein, partial [Thermoanaerobaculia bacterium]|nr:Ig-like domain-containing protein [Thermoanaerobaculia bacterium]